MTGDQCKMARAGLNMGVRELATEAQVSPSTVARLEAGDELKPRTVLAMRQALEKWGAIFIDANGDDVGVRFRHGALDERRRALAG